MTVYSQNGYSANDRSVVQTYTIGATKKVALRKGSTGALLVHMANWFDANIRDIDPGELDEWGYAERPIRGGTELSNHASGTALDVDATKWPLGVEPSAYLTAAEIARVRQQLKVYEGCIRWGGDYAGRKDPMHLEIDRDQATCDRVWAKLSTAAAQKPTTEEDDMFNDGDRRMLWLILRQLGLDKNMANGNETVPGWPQLGTNAKGQPLSLVDALAEMKSDIDAIKAKLDQAT